MPGDWRIGFGPSGILTVTAPQGFTGTYSGYSSLSMAAGLPEGGRIDTCEVDETHAEVARRYIARSPYADRITVHLGPALATIEQLDGEFDFVFIDADKENYVNYYEAVLPKVTDDGLHPGWFERVKPTYAAALAAFVNALEDGTPISPSLEDGLKAQAIAEAATRSLTSGRAEPISC
jgi:tRNA A58 N-methylase Trm61